MNRISKPAIPHYQTPEPLRKAMAERSMRSMEMAMKIAKATQERYNKLHGNQEKSNHD